MKQIVELVEDAPCPQCGATLWWCDCDDIQREQGPEARHLICSASGSDAGECDYHQVRLLVTVVGAPSGMSHSATADLIKARLEGHENNTNVAMAEQDGVHHSYGLTTTSYPVYREVPDGQ